MRTWLDHHPRPLLAGGLITWFLFAFVFIVRSPAGAFTHDFNGHLQFTHILYNERRLPLPLEGWETYQPPIYYLVNTLFSPRKMGHTFQIRLLSALYGLLTLLLIIRVLARHQVTPSAQMVVLSFIATTPSFLFLFTAYNNDSLATLFSVALLAAAEEWILFGKRGSILLFGVLAVLGLYTKLTVLFPLGTLCVVLGFLGFSRRVGWERILFVFGAVGLGVLLLSPWLIGHNYRHTGRFMPTPADSPVDPRVHLPQSAVRTVLTPPLWSRQEWKDPYAHLWEELHTKKNSYLAYFFTTSVFSEYRFESLPPALPWAIVILHAVLWIAALARARKTPMGRLAVGFLGLGAAFMTSLIFRAPYASHMDFRYIAWVWLPFALLYAANLVPGTSSTRNFSTASIFRVLMVSGAVLQGFFWLALLAGGRWNIPL